MAFWGGWGQSPTEPSPALTTPQTHISAIFARLPRWPLGARGSSRSHFLKWRSVIRQLGPPFLSRVVGGVPVVGPQVSLPERPLFPGLEWHRGLSQGPPKPLCPQSPASFLQQGGAVRGLAGSLGEQRRHCVSSGGGSPGSGWTPAWSGRLASWAHPEESWCPWALRPAAVARRRWLSEPQARWLARCVQGVGSSPGPPAQRCRSHIRAQDPRLHPPHLPAARAHLGLGQRDGQQLPQQEQSQGGGSSHGRTGAPSGAGGMRGRGSGSAGGAGGGQAASSRPRRLLRTSPPFSGAHLGGGRGPPRCPRVSAAPARGEKTQRGGMWGSLWVKTIPDR